MKRSSYRELDLAFGQVMLTLRTAIGLTQAGLADFLGVSRHAVGGWEAGQSYPKANHLKHVVELGIQQQAFAAGHEAEEIRALWHAARQKVLLDEQWLQELLKQEPRFPMPAEQKGTANAVDTFVHTSEPLFEWDDALDVSTFYGRDTEQTLLARWLVEERCRVVSVLGMGGIGKSALAVTVMRQVAAQFEVVIWRSLRDAPACETLLDTCFQVLAPHSLLNAPESLEGRIQLLIKQLRNRRVLLVLDNLEVLLEEGAGAGRMRAGFEGYTQLLRRIGETVHQSCLLLTSREKLADLVLLEGSRSPVRALRLVGLDAEAGAQLLAEQDVAGSLADQVHLVERYSGNPLALKIVAQTITELFGGTTALFLRHSEAVFGGVRELLSEQFNRLSALEQSVCYWLAILREPATLEELLAVLSTPRVPAHVLQALEGLRHRSLIEHGQRAGSFTLQSVVLEYVTARLIDEVSGEIEQGELVHLNAYALCQAQAKEYVRKTQEHVLVLPICTRLHNTYHGQANLEARILALLDHLRERRLAAQGYGPANLVALLRMVRGHLRDLDFSHLALRDAPLQGVEMQDTRLSDAVIQESVFTEAFDAIRMIAVSKDGHYWAAGSRRGKIRIWTQAGTVLQRVWQAHRSNITAFAFSPDGLTLASVGFDTTVKLWSVESGALLWTARQIGCVNAVAFAPDGQLLASAGNDGYIYLWNAHNGTEVQKLAAQHATIGSLAWSPDGKLLASGCTDGNILVWDLLQKVPRIPLHKLAGHTDWVSGLAFAPDSRYLASASSDGTVKLWDPARGDFLRTVLEHAVPMQRVVWSPDGHTLASSSFDQNIWLWDVLKGEVQVRAILHGHTGVIQGLAFAPDSRTLLSASDDGTIRVWDAGDGQLLRTIGGYVAMLLDIDWSPDATRLATVGTDTQVLIWKRSDVTRPIILGGHRWIAQGVAWSPDGHLLASGGYDNSVVLWDTTTGVRLHELHDSEAVDTIFLDVAWSPDGRLLAGGTYLRGVYVWDVKTRARLWVGRTEPTLIRQVIWSPDGTKVVGGGDDGSIRMWDARNGVLQQQFAAHSEALTSVVWNADGTRLVSGGGGEMGGELFVWDADTGKLVRAIVGHSGLVTAVAWSSRDDLVISGSNDGFVRWWDVQSGACARAYEGHQGTVQALKISPDGGMLASCGDDGAIGLWDIRTGERLQTLRRDRPYERMDITGLTGISDAQRVSLLALGAIDRGQEQERVVGGNLQALVSSSRPADTQQRKVGNQNVVLGMPFLPTACIGRDAELREIATLLADPACRLLTLLGPGGMGKTRLALESASAHTTAFADGVAFVALASVSTPNQIASAISATLNLAFDGQADPTLHLLSFLRQRHMLLVLDNFEHLLDGVDLVTAILAQAPRITLLVTSRERLNLQAEWLVAIDGLAYPSEDFVEPIAPQSYTKPAAYSAVELFVQRAMQVEPGFAVSAESLVTIARICRYVAGMPLAIELAAATLHMLPLVEVERQIRASADVLATTLRDVPVRHRSLRAVFDHSWNLLSERERVLFCRLAVFQDGWTTVAAEQVTEATLTVMTALIDKSLVRQDSLVTDTLADSLSTPVATTRFTMLEPIREYAKERLAATPDDTVVRQRHAHYFTRLAEVAMAEWSTPTHDSAMTRLRREHNNMRAALEWYRDRGAALEGLRLTEALWRFWRSYGYTNEGRAWLGQLLALTDTASDPTTLAARQRGLRAAAWLASDQHDFVVAARLFERSMELRHTLGETEGEIDLRLNAARQARAAGLYQQATALLEDALSHHRATAYQASGSDATPRLSIDELGQVLRELGLVLREQGQFQRAADLFAEGIQLHSGIGDRAGVAFALLGLADIARDQGDAPGVRRHAEPSLAILHEIGMQWAIGFALNTLAQGAYLEHDLTRARSLISESIELFRSLRAEASLTEILLTQGQIVQAQGDIAAAYAAITESLRLAQRVGPRLFIAAALEALANLTSVSGHIRAAVQLFAAASALRSQMGIPLRPVDQPLNERVLTTAHATLGEHAFAALWKAASDLPLEQLLDIVSGVGSQDRVS